MKIGLIPITAKPVVEEGETVCAPNYLVYSLAKELKKLSHQITVFAGSNSAPELNIVSLGMRAPFDEFEDSSLENSLYLSRVREYNRQLTEEAIKMGTRGELDLISNHDIRFNLDLLAKCRMPVVCTVHGDMAADQASLAPQYEQGRKSKNIFFTAITRGNLQFCQKNHLQVLGLTPSGVDTEKFAFSNQKRQGILYVGRVIPHKRTEETIKGALQAGREITVIGPKGTSQEDLAYFKRLDENYFSKGKVRYLGYKKPSELVSYYQRAEALVMLSQKEATSLVILEALSTGLPVIASKIEGISDMLEDGKNGFLIEDFSAEKIAQKIKEVGKISPQACRKSVEDGFSLLKMAQNYLLSFNKSLDKITFRT